MLPIVPSRTHPLPMAVYEVAIEMVRRAKMKRAYALLFFPHGPATLAISGENFKALRALGVPLITPDEARGVLRPKRVSSSA